jgi:hypothetical protein
VRLLTRARRPKLFHEKGGYMFLAIVLLCLSVVAGLAGLDLAAAIIGAASACAALFAMVRDDLDKLD